VRRAWASTPGEEVRVLLRQRSKMPGFLDRDPRCGWADSFDTAAAASLYWKQVPVVLRLHDREEHACDLTVRIFSGTSHGSHAYRVSSVFCSSGECAA